MQPTVTATTPGLPVFSFQTRLPQTGQKCRVTVLPVSDVTAKLAALP